MNASVRDGFNNSVHHLLLILIDLLISNSNHHRCSSCVPNLAYSTTRQTVTNINQDHDVPSTSLTSDLGRISMWAPTNHVCHGAPKHSPILI